MALWYNPLDTKYFPASSTSLKLHKKLNAMFLLSLGHIVVMNLKKPPSDAPIPDKTLSKVPAVSGGGGESKRKSHFRVPYINMPIFRLSCPGL